MNKIQLHVLLDVNVYINALKDRPVVTHVGSLYAAVPLLAEIAAAPQDLVHLTDSDHILDLVESKAQEVLGYTADEAATLAELISEVSTVSSGFYVDREEGSDHATRLSAGIPGRFLGDGRGEIDHEDLQVLGAAKGALDGSSSAEMALIVTSDGGFHNISENITRMKIHVAHSRAAITAIRAVSAHSR